MNNVQCLSHTKWDCKFHVVWIPKCRRKMLYGQLRKNLGEVLHDLARQKESRVLEGHLQSDHVHMLISIPPKYAVSQVVGYMKGKSAIHIARTYLGQRKNYSGMSFGHGAILFQLSVPMKRLCGLTSASKNKKTIVSSNCNYSDSRPPNGGQRIC